MHGVIISVKHLLVVVVQFISVKVKKIDQCVCCSFENYYGGESKKCRICHFTVFGRLLTIRNALCSVIVLVKHKLLNILKLNVR